MDDIVLAALKKWPNVPHCYGWLALDTRGDWYLRDESAQRAGPFPRIKGSRIEHSKLCEFIARNYAHDEKGSWFFQNGPQRVYVQLEAAPWVWRVHWQGDAARVDSHTGIPVQPRAAYLDETGRLFLETDIGLGIVHSQDMVDAAHAVDGGQWSPEELLFAQAPARFGYTLDPQTGS